MNINLLNPMILAENYEELVEWYIKTFDLTVKNKVDEGEECTELERAGELILGIAKANEMGVKPSTPRNNTVIIQFSVSDINELFDRIKETGGRVLFGPSLEEKGGYWYGGFADIEGNQMWVVEKNAE